MAELEFSGRTALVTGGSRGIGRACVEMLARNGASVAVNFRSNSQAAQLAVEAVKSLGQRAIAVQADVSNEAQVRSMVETVEQELGPIDLLINNAGVFHFATHDQTDLAIWNDTIACNLTGVFLVTWSVKQSMIERGFGRIVNLSSISALRARPNSIAYAASKAGVTGFTKSVAEAFAADNIRVNAIAPGLIDTEILNGVDQGMLDRIVETTPLGRIGTPDDIADVARFLLSDESRFMTGQTVVVSGGRVMLP
ncbi:glucose 1-dehydrogenase [bacterium]|nr:glucose 1-dehydrogenase [bacterium]